MDSKLLFPKGSQFLDRHGVPVCGGSLYLYEHQGTDIIQLVSLTTRTHASLFDRLTGKPVAGGRVPEDIFCDRLCDVELKDSYGASIPITSLYVLWSDDDQSHQRNHIA